jgi:hypothetical protein
MPALSEGGHMGVGEMIMFLMALGGFGVAPNSHAPSAAEVTKYAPDDADLLVYADIEATVPSNYALLQKLPDDPAVKGVPELRKEIQKVTAHLEEKRASHKKMLGWDPVTDVKSLTLWLSPPQMGNDPLPEFLVALRGKFPADAIERGAKAAGEGTIEKVEGRPVWISPPPSVAIGMAPDGTALIGSMALVKARMSPSFKANVKKGSISDRASATLDDKPFFAVVTKPSMVTTTLLGQVLSDDEAALFRDLLTGQEWAAIGLRSNGAQWTYAAHTPQGYQRALMASDGVIQLLRSGHFFLRGLADVMLAALDSYAKDPVIAKVVQHKADILKLVGTWSGDGNFGAQVDKKDGDKTVSVKLTGKTFSDVVPATALMIPGAMTMILLRKSAAVEASPPAEPARIAPSRHP